MMESQMLLNPEHLHRVLRQLFLLKTQNPKLMKSLQIMMRLWLMNLMPRNQDWKSNRTLKILGNV